MASHQRATEGAGRSLDPYARRRVSDEIGGARRCHLYVIMSAAWSSSDLERNDRLGDHPDDATSDPPPAIALYAAGVGLLFVGFGVVSFSFRLMLCIVGVWCE